MITLDQLDAWEKLTWHQMLVSARNKDVLEKLQKKEFLNCLAALRSNRDYAILKDKPVTGSISQGWKDLNQSGPLFQQSLETVAAAYPSDWTPAEYALHYFAECMRSDILSRNVDLGRSLRNLPSFLREYLLLAAIKEAGFDVELPSVQDNAHQHVDLILNLGERRVTIWNYLTTENAVNKLKTKIQKRGVIRTGFNLLAPIDNKLDTKNYHDWYIPTQDYVARLVTAAASAASHKEIDLASLTNKAFMDFLLFVK